MTPTEIALVLHACGIVSIPLSRESKVPLVKWEPLQWVAERPNEAEVRNLFAKFPGANAAMLAGETSQLWFVDADSAEAFDTMRRCWPDAPWVTNTRRGGHFRFRVPDDVSIRNLRNEVHICFELPNGTRAEVDTRGQGGYVVAPGSVHPSGFVYASAGWPWKPEDRERLPWFEPDWYYTKPSGVRRTFGEAVAEHKHCEERPEPQTAPNLEKSDHTGGSPLERTRRYLGRCPGAVEGCGGDSYTFRLACVVVNDFGLDDGQAYGVLSEWNATCSPPWSERELREKIGNARRYAKGFPGKKRDQPAPERLTQAAPTPASTPDTPALSDAGDEARVLGAALRDVDSAWLANQHVGVDHFAGRNAVVFCAITELLTKGAPIETQSVLEQLRQTGQLEAAGGSEYLAKLTATAARPEALEFFSKLVAGKHRLRKIANVASRIALEASHGAGSPDEVSDRCASWFMKATEVCFQDDATWLADGLKTEMDRVDRNERVFGLKTHLDGIDALLRGLKPEEFYVIAARPSMGKSSLGFGLAREIAVHDNYATGIFSLEMSKPQVCVNLLGQFTGISPTKIADAPALSPTDRERLRTRWNDLAAAPILIDASNNLTLLQLRAKARRMRVLHNVSLVIVDFLQLVQGIGETRAEEVSFVAKGLKQMARELRIPVLALAQLNRAVESRDGHRPRMADLKESGGIEEAADVVMLLWREGYYKRDKPELQRKAEVIVEKNRNGPTGSVALEWESECVRFSNPKFGP